MLERLPPELKPPDSRPPSAVAAVETFGRGVVDAVADCVAEASKDVTVLTSLLECRLIVGQRARYAALSQALAEAMDPKAFFVAKQLEMRQRHQKFENTPYALEPNCKESPGGLRDLQIILWVAKAAGLGRSWD